MNGTVKNGLQKLILMTTVTPFLELDVNLDFDGVGNKNFEDTLDWWRLLTEGFEEFIDW